MYFNVLILLVISFSFNFANSFINSFEHSQIFENYVNMLQSSNYVDTNADIKTFGINKLSSICHYVIRNLRRKNHYENMYVNYFLFKLKEKEVLCSDESIWVPSLNKYVTAPLCFCFGRPPVLIFERTEETLRYYQELSFYPLSRDQIAVYKFNLPGRFYTLLEIFENIIWENLSIDDVLFMIPLPVSYSDTANLQRMLHPFLNDLTMLSINSLNVLNLSDHNMFSTICEIVLRPAKYENKIIYKKTPNSQKPDREFLIALLSQTDICSIEAYKCEGLDPRTSKLTKKYSIAAGPLPDSVIVLKKIHSSNHDNQQIDNRYEIIEYIINLSLTYLHYYSENLY